MQPFGRLAFVPRGCRQCRDDSITLARAHGDIVGEYAPEMIGKILKANGAARGVDKDSLDQVAQFAHIARSVVREQIGPKVTIGFADSEPGAAVEFSQEVFKEDQDVFSPFAQRGEK